MRQGAYCKESKYGDNVRRQKDERTAINTEQANDNAEETASKNGNKGVVG